MTPTATIGLGLVPVGRRSVTRIPANVLAMVPQPTDQVITVKEYGADPVKDTVPLMRDKIRRTAWQVKRLARHLKKGTIPATLQSDWEFIFRHIQYVKDPAGEEQVRSPRRLIYDRKGDCDCFTVTLGTLLLQQRIPFKIRVAAYKGAKSYSHVYIVVPKSGDADKALTSRDQYWVLDPVVHKFDHEVQFTSKRDFSMKLTSLDGLSGGALGAPCSPGGGRRPLRRFINTQYLERLGFVPTAKILRDRGIIFRDVVDEKTQRGQILVATANGPLTLPTVMTQEQAQKAIEAINAPKIVAAVTDTADKITQKMKDSPWWAVGLGAVGLWLLSK